jgi:hypothetical protein
VDVDIAQASHASFETLMHARKKDVDPFKDVDPKKLLAFSLQRLSQAHPGKVHLHTTHHQPCVARADLCRRRRRRRVL